MLKLQRSQQTTEEKAYKPLAARENLLIVDDELILQKLLERLFAQEYNVRTAESGARAMEILQEGFVPQVILADQRMPGMSGVEFLAKSREIVPDAVRVILTGYTDVHDIIASINEGYVYKFLTKPWKNEELLLMVKKCIEHYKLTTENKWLLEEIRLQNLNLHDTNKKLEVQNEELRELNIQIKDNMLQIKNNMLQTVRMLSSLVSAGERYYYTNHAQTVAVIARALAVEVGMDEDIISNIVIAALLHDIGKVGLSEKILLTEPEDMTPFELVKYKSHVDKGWRLIRTVKGLEEVADIVLQHHEHYDGSGFPFGLEGNQIVKAAQIIALASDYHNKVFRIAPQDFSVGDEHLQSFVQSPEITSHRQAKAIAFIRRKMRWYNPDVLDAFIDLAKRGSCPPLQIGVLMSRKAIAPTAAKPTPLPFASQEISSDPHKAHSYKPIILSIPEVQIGMVTAQDIYTISGTLIIPEGTSIDYAKFQKLRELCDGRSIPFRLLFYEPLT